VFCKQKGYINCHKKFLFKFVNSWKSELIASLQEKKVAKKLEKSCFLTM